MSFAEKIKLLNSNICFEIENLSCGGCGIFCYLMKKKLDELGIESKIIAFDYYPRSIKKAKSNIRNFLSNKPFNNQMGASHFVVSAEGILFDGYHTYKNTKEVGFGEAVDFYTIEELKIAINHGEWNTTYDRIQNIKLIECINLAFSETNS